MITVIARNSFRGAVVGCGDVVEVCCAGKADCCELEVGCCDSDVAGIGGAIWPGLSVIISFDISVCWRKCGPEIAGPPRSE